MESYFELVSVDTEGNRSSIPIQRIYGDEENRKKFKVNVVEHGRVCVMRNGDMISLSVAGSFNNPKVEFRYEELMNIVKTILAFRCEELYDENKDKI